MSIKVLIVDDNELVRQVLRAAVAGRNYELFDAADGPSAVATAEREKPDVVILDLMLPEMHGLDVLRHIRKNCPESKVIILSALRADELGGSTLEAGAAAYLTKPVSVADLRTAIDRLL